jgi:hypothetical protein
MNACLSNFHERIILFMKSKFNFVKLNLHKYSFFESLCVSPRGDNVIVFVYQMGKVASTSIYKSLLKYGFCVFHAHVLNFPREKEEHLSKFFLKTIKFGRKLRKNIFDSGLPVKIITMTRDPVARNISAYFQNLDAIHGKRHSHLKVSLPSLISGFIVKYNHDIPVTWFDREFYEVTGINVYSYTFPKDKGYMFIKHNNIQALIMNAELDNKIKSMVIGEFVGCPDFVMQNSNISLSKKYSSQYADFMENIRLPKDYVENLLDSKYSKHFYSTDDLNGFKEKWLNL